MGTVLRKPRKIAFLLVVVLSAGVLAGIFYPRPGSDIAIESSRSGYLSRPAVAFGGDGRPFVLWQSWADNTGRIMISSIDRSWGFFQNRIAADDLGGVATSAYPRIVASGSRVYASWIDCCRGSGGAGSIAVTLSTDNGVSFSRNLFAPANDGAQEDIGADDAGNLYLVWREGPSSIPGSIAFSSLTAGGTSFTNPAFIDFPGSEPTIAVDNGNIFLAWRAGNGSLIFRRSVDRGQTFDPEVQIDSARQSNRFTPQLAAQDGQVFLVWQSHEVDGVHIRIAVSTDNGLSLGEAIDLEDVPGQEPFLDPSLTIGLDGKVYVAWSSYKNFLEMGLTIRAKKASQPGGPWTEFITGASKTGKSDQAVSGIAVDQSGNYFIAYDLVDNRDEISGQQQARLMTSLSLPLASFQWLGDHGVELAVASLATIAAFGLFLLLRRRTRPGVQTKLTTSL